MSGTLEHATPRDRSALHSTHQRAPQSLDATGNITKRASDRSTCIAICFISSASVIVAFRIRVRCFVVVALSFVVSSSLPFLLLFVSLR